MVLESDSAWTVAAIITEQDLPMTSEPNSGCLDTAFGRANDEECFALSKIASAAGDQPSEIQLSRDTLAF